MNLPVNLKILLTGLLKPINYSKKSVDDNIGPFLKIVLIIFAKKIILPDKLSDLPAHTKTVLKLIHSTLNIQRFELQTETFLIRIFLLQRWID
jgi:hypothetical protein